MFPGDFIEKTITVENTGTEPSGYKLEWLELQNEFYSMEIRIEGTCTSYKDGVVAGTCESFEKGVGSTIIHRVDSIGGGYTHEYNIKILFKETDKLQNYNQGKNFSGKIGISDFVRPVPVYANGVKPVNNCTFDGELVQGAEYVNGQYTYIYMQKLVFNEDTGKETWMPISEDGWGIVLTDRSSTEAVTTKLCTSINGKPIVSMNHMFSFSEATTLDLSSFDTSNVTTMSSMFSSSEATSLDLSSFDTSKVTDMSWMFDNTGYNSTEFTLNLGNNFDTSNVTDMGSMFNNTGYNSTKFTLDCSNWNVDNVTNYSYFNNGVESKVTAPTWKN